MRFAPESRIKHFTISLVLGTKACIVHFNTQFKHISLPEISVTLAIFQPTKYHKLTTKLPRPEHLFWKLLVAWDKRTMFILGNTSTVKAAFLLLNFCWYSSAAMAFQRSTFYKSLEFSGYRPTNLQDITTVREVGKNKCALYCLGKRDCAALIFTTRTCFLLPNQTWFGGLVVELDAIFFKRGKRIIGSLRKILHFSLI